ncbi:MAG: hypothetical protein GTN57_08245, partial [Acidobacteria bacterium]|nr:hypothetical protein [Acidobacteriota bacterium]NIT11062.1 hypothetical protein [Acidobacteriota bacterium]
ALAALPVGEWSGPIRSAYGLHLARVSRREPGELPTFELARDVVEREWRAERRVEAKEAFYQGLSERYDVVIEDFVESDETAVAGTAAGPPGDTHASR